ncbi:HugZ family protein [Ruegeria sp.]|uniref:HugZ family pyridoxamine 5'-phosphate oxidase n=1 Tax=Ruegeria sp. TaxID=1879320 RepID=UPI003B5C7D2C
MADTDPHRTADKTARTLAHDLIGQATYGALATLRPGSAMPSVSRIALATDGVGRLMSLISTLSDHTQALTTIPTCALLIGEPQKTGDPLTHPRLTLHATAVFVQRTSTEHEELRTRYLAARPKAKLYADFADFRFVRFEPTDALLNGGFGKAWRLNPTDLSV